MRVFVYEFVTGGGWYSAADDLPPESLVREGRAMLEALVADFAALAGVTVETLQDVRQQPISQLPAAVHFVAGRGEEQQAILRCAGDADWTVLIAPEFDGHLLARARLVERSAGRLLGPGAALIELAGDKHATCEHLSRHGVSVPRGAALAKGDALPAAFSYPAVLKPRDGAGSLDMRWLTGADESIEVQRPMRLEAHCSGQAASVALLCGPNAKLPLAPCRQDLSPPEFAYRGGSLPLEGHLAERATRLALAAAHTLAEARGYLGVDLVLGAAEDGSQDYIIEINPRLTTSYVGLRALSRVNLAAAMVAIARGDPVELCWKSEQVQFTSAGDVSFG